MRLEDLDIDGKAVILEEYGVKVRAESRSSVWCLVANFCEHGNKPWDSLRVEFEQLIIISSVWILHLWELISFRLRAHPLNNDVKLCVWPNDRNKQQMQVLLLSPVL
jgi:hypothetical protein